MRGVEHYAAADHCERDVAVGVESSEIGAFTDLYGAAFGFETEQTGRVP